MKQTLICISIQILGLTMHLSATSADAKGMPFWNEKKAADYLDQRIEWWMAWPGSARDERTFCISCHTVVPYALARPALREAMREQTLSANEQRLLQNVARRVRLWNRIQPFYHDGIEGTHKTVESRGTEAVLNALILANYAAQDPSFRDDERTAFRNMWALQRTDGDQSGAWWWLQFNNEPFEAHDSNYYGAALAAGAVGMAPEDYRSSPEIQSNLKLLREYLNREYRTQSPINHVVLLWASSQWPGLITRERRRSIIDEVTATQQAGGGWNLASLAWSWRDWKAISFIKMFFRSYGTPLRARSDGYATALIAFALEQAGIRRDDAHLKRALAWLIANQEPTRGLWTSYSLNNMRDPKSDTGRFMSDAATAYAVLALTGINH